jgi:16S rRNA (adenine1518-N6/adenine1519-N6)-dimethyltransferase
MTPTPPFPKPQIDGIAIKKQYGQHFLRDQTVIDAMVNAVTLNSTSSIFEIGCGDGFLTRSILKQPLARLWVFEIDPEWAEYVKTHYPDERMTIFTENILDIDFAKLLATHQPWTLLANLPYQITFPILFLLQKNRTVLREGVIMVQEEVAHKLLKTSGRDYGFTSLFFQHYFVWQSLKNIPPAAFFPSPKVHSRILHFAPRATIPEIPEEVLFWKFIKSCFAYPRRTLKNNLAATTYWPRAEAFISHDLLRAQEMTFEDFLALWKKLQPADSLA